MWLVSVSFVAALVMSLVTGCGDAAEEEKLIEKAEEEAGVEEVVQLEPTPDDVVKAFEDEGLEVDKYYHVEEGLEWGTRMLPKTKDCRARFEWRRLQDCCTEALIWKARSSLS